MERRSFLGTMLAGIGTALGVDTEPTVINTDQFFDTIANIPCIPVDTWINKIKAHVWEEEQWSIQVLGRSVPNRLHNMFLDQIPIYYPREVIEKAIKSLPPKYPALDMDFNHQVREGEIPLLFISNARIDNSWLFVDILVGKEDLPIELKHLTQYRTKQLVEWMTGEGLPQHIRDLHNNKKYPWPRYGGVSPLELQIWPAAKGDAELTKDGIAVTNMEIITFRALSSPKFNDPYRLSYMWRGKHIHKIAPHYYVVMARDAKDAVCNPYHQIPENWTPSVTSADSGTA